MASVVAASEAEREREQRAWVGEREAAQELRLQLLQQHTREVVGVMSARSTAHSLWFRVCLHFMAPTQSCNV
jgi:hypothetical protein